MGSSLNLVDFLSTETIALNCSISTKKKLFVEISSLLTQATNEDLTERDIFNLLIDREKMGNTGVGLGVALPHSRCANVDEAVMAIVSIPEGVDYDSIDGTPVTLVFGLLVPEQATQTHLDILSKVAKTVSTPERVAAMTKIESADALMAYLAESQLN